MCEPTRKLPHILLSHERKFSFVLHFGYFRAHIVPKIVEFSEKNNCFIITKMTTFKLLFLWYISLGVKNLYSFSLEQ